MPSRSQLLSYLQNSYSYEEVGLEFGIPPGLAYMIVTGLPADGGDVLRPEELAGRAGVLDGSTQSLVNPPTDMPKHKDTVEQWIKDLAAADEAMRNAGEERTATPPPIEAEDDTDDVVSVIGWQHNQVKYLEEQLETIPGVKQGGNAPKQQQRVSIVDMIRTRLSKHETAEEEHFWPAVREHLDDGHQLADTALEQEQKGKDIFQALTGLGGDDGRFDDLVEDLTDALRKHVAHEDTVLLAFKQAVPDDIRSDIGRKFRKAYGRAPTRSHPHAPDEGTALRAAAALAAPLDRMRDALGDRPAQREGKAETQPDNEVTRELQQTKETEAE